MIARQHLGKAAPRQDAFSSCHHSKAVGLLAGLIGFAPLDEQPAAAVVPAFDVGRNESGALSAPPLPGGPVPGGGCSDPDPSGGHQGGDHGEAGLKGPAAAPTGGNSGESVVAGWDLRPLKLYRRPDATPAGNPAVRPVQGRGPSDFAGGPDVETAVRTTGVLTTGCNLSRSGEPF